MIKKSAGPLKIALHGMDGRAIKTIMLFLQGPCNGAAIVINNVVDADLDIFDAEATDSKKLLDKHLLGKIMRPVIVMSLREYAHEGVIHLSKPIKTSEMLLVLDKARNLAKEISKKSLLLETPQIPENVEKDLMDFFNDDFFDYISTNSWDEPQKPQGIPEKLREVKAPEPQPTSATNDQSVSPENQAIPATNLEAESQAYTEELTQEKHAVESEKLESITNHLDQDEPKNDFDNQTAVSTQLGSELQSNHEDSEQSLEVDEKQELKTFVSDIERKKTSKHQTARRLDEKSFIDYIGDLDGIDVDDPKQFSKAFYNPNDYFQGFFQSALVGSLKTNQALLLQSSWCPIAVFPNTREVWLDARDSELNTFAEIKLRHKTIETKITVTPINSLPMNLGYALDKFQNVDAFIWKLACWTSKGRYPQEIDYQLPVYLRNWPNFSRLLITPHALRIAALLIQGPRTMGNVAQMLNIKPKYVFVFISAANAIGLAGQARRITDSLIEPREIKPSKGQGLLGRIMSKLRN